jgi:hypothetical protein
MSYISYKLYLLEQNFRKQKGWSIVHEERAVFDCSEFNSASAPVIFSASKRLPALVEENFLTD